MAETIEFKIKLTEDQLEDALKRLRNEVPETQKKLKTLTDVFKDMGAELSSIKASFIGNLGASAVSKAFSLLGSAVNEVADQTRSFSRSLAEINSILPKNERLTQFQTEALIKLSSQYGKSAQEQAKAYYEIISSGIQSGTVALNLLRASNEAATAGLTSTATASKVLTAAFNAFAQQGTTVKEISDSLFQAVKDGTTTFEELSGSLGRVTPLAAAMGITINEVSGSVAFLTKSGLGTEQAITGIRSALAAIIKPSGDAVEAIKQLNKENVGLNLEFSSNGIKAAGGFAGFLDKVRVAANGNASVIAKLFGDINAINAVTSIANGNFKDFTSILDSNKNSLGATSAAAKIVKKSLDFQAGQLTQELKNLALTVGNSLIPAFEFLNKTVQDFKSLIGANNRNIDENVSKLRELKREYDKNVGTLKLLENGTFKYNSQLSNLTPIQVQEKIIELQTRQNQLLKERAAIPKITTEIGQAELKKNFVGPPAPIKPPVESDVSGGITALDKSIVESRKSANEQLLQAQAQYGQFAIQQEQDIYFQKVAFDEANRVTELERLAEFNNQKINSQFSAEESKNLLITDSEAKRLATQATNLKKGQALAAANVETQKKFDAAAAANKQRSLQLQLDYISTYGNLAASIAQDGSKTQFLIQKGTAIASSIIATNLAAAQALAVPPAPNVGLAATARTLGSINTAAIIATAIKGFANGGIVGATQGSDNRLATVRDGEMVLNADQQRVLFDSISGGQIGNNQPIIIQIDGREIARVVRNQVQQGFRLA